MLWLAFNLRRDLSSAAAADHGPLRQASGNWRESKFPMGTLAWPYRCTPLRIYIVYKGRPPWRADARLRLRAFPQWPSRQIDVVNWTGTTTAKVLPRDAPQSTRSPWSERLRPHHNTIRVSILVVDGSTFPFVLSGSGTHTLTQTPTRRDAR